MGHLKEIKAEAKKKNSHKKSRVLKYNLLNNQITCKKSPIKYFDLTIKIN